jgi:hypothetical protein
VLQYSQENNPGGESEKQFGLPHENSKQFVFN